jgi:ferrochelatase
MAFTGSGIEELTFVRRKFSRFPGIQNPTLTAILSGHCAETVRLLRARLGLGEQALLTFQSRFGRAEWLTPYTDITVNSLVQQGVKNLAVITPGFSADCLETLEEIAVENAGYFKSGGGVNFAAIPCLNDSEGGMSVIAHLVRRELQGWV